MNNSVKLNSEEKNLKNQLEQYEKSVWENITNDDEKYDAEHIKQLYGYMANTAHDLHMSLTSRGFTPKHHKYMIENRGCSPEDIRFYEHVHPVHDLLAFIDNMDANNDPEDTTIGVEFDLHIYTRRWNAKDLYHITRTASGWYVRFLTFEGECDKAAAPVLYDSLEHDGVCYPKQLGDFLEWLWEKAATDGLDKKRVQEAFDDICEWISSCEKHTPRGIFKGLI